MLLKLNKKLDEIELQVQHLAITAGARTPRNSDTTDYHMAWMDMICACRDYFQWRVGQINENADRCKNLYQRKNFQLEKEQLKNLKDSTAYAQKVNTIWELLQDVMDTEKSNILELVESRLPEIQDMPDPYYHEFIGYDDNLQTMGHRAIDEFFPYFNLAPDMIAYRQKTAYQRYLWYHTNGIEGTPPGG